METGSGRGHSICKAPEPWECSVRRVQNLSIDLGQTSKGQGEWLEALLINSYLGICLLNQLLLMPAYVSLARPISTNTSLACSCQHWLKTCSVFQRLLLSGVQQARCARISIPPPKTGGHSHLTGGISWDACSTLAPKPPVGFSSHCLQDAPWCTCVGCLLFSISEPFCHVPLGISWDPISSKNLTLESWS